MQRIFGSMLATLGLIVVNATALAQTDIEPATDQRLPKWEIRAGFGAMSIPYYRGSSETSGLFIPLILPIYRGEKVQVDRRGIRGSLFRGDRWSLELSADGNIPADSDDLAIREGMPDLSPSVQIGPSLKYTFWTEPSKKQIVRLNFPLRAVFAFESGIENTGYTFSPSVTYAGNVSTSSDKWRWGLYAGLEFGSEGYHDYFYQVDEEFVRSDRPAYDAQGGYGGIRLATSIRRRTDAGSFSLFARYDRYDDAEFIDSPLVDSKDGLTVGVFFVKTLFKSTETVKVAR